MKTKLGEICPEYLTTGAVAKNCGVSKVTVLRWIEKGDLSAFRLPGGQNRIHRDDYYAFADKHGIPVRHMRQQTNDKNHNYRQKGKKNNTQVKDNR